MKPSVLLIDNHDSFTYNLAQLLDQSGICRWEIFPSGMPCLSKVKSFDKVIFSPGPGIPAERPMMFEVLQEYASSKSILGVCLGHQSIVEYYGGRLMNLPGVVHGLRQEVLISEPVDSLFSGLPLVFHAGLYHSWAADDRFLPACLRITARNKNGVVMSVAHDQYDTRGVQFHPESYMTEFGQDIINNWLKL